MIPYLLCLLGWHHDEYHTDTSGFLYWRCRHCGRAAVYRKNISPEGWYELEPEHDKGGGCNV